ncbi:hypothetical protein [Streptomyces sp. NPDC051286]|uniref:hypothetical protein n=1 Tax=Streptomyces sp. NPDC051286 TaxID=3365647 RepID=UPI0037ABCD6A
MRTRTNRVPPLPAAAAGLLAGAVGTVCLDAVNYVKYRRAGGTDGPLSWEFPAVENWQAAPDPGRLAKRVIEKLTRRELPDRAAGITSTVAHWGYGSTAGAAYGIVIGLLAGPAAGYGVPFGAAVFANDYITLPIAGIYQPIWKYSAKVLGWDLGAHLAYGAGTGIAFKLLAKAGSAATRRSSAGRHA